MTARLPRVAVIGSGVAGLGAAFTLADRAAITLFEAGRHFGGHAHTVDVTLPDAHGKRVTHGVDTGFLVFNERTYPQLIQLFRVLGVPVARSDMSFSCQVPGARGARPLEWSGTSLSTVFAQRGNLVNPRFLRMLADLLRFNALATRLAVAGEDAALMRPLGDFLEAHRFSAAFRDWYLLPMLGCIWSCPTEQMLRFPVATMVRFCHNHGLLQIANRPQWYTVQGGSRAYVDRIVEGIADRRLNTPVERVERHARGVAVTSRGVTEIFDKAILATHPDQALAVLHDARPDERRTLGAIGYQANRAVLHTDTSVLPRHKAAWSAWNYERPASAGDGATRVCLHYLIDRLQPLPFAQPVIVSLNPLREVPAQHVLGAYDYAHPVFDEAAIQAQTRLPALQGTGGVYFCGAWTGYGFHEDGLRSGVAAAEQLLADIAWQASPQEARA